LSCHSPATADARDGGEERGHKRRGLPTSGSPTQNQEIAGIGYHLTNNRDNPARETRYLRQKKAWQAAR
jgi:hypothetical protein